MADLLRRRACPLKFFMILRSSFRWHLAVTAVLVVFTTATQAQTLPQTPDIPAKYDAPTQSYDYIKREVMVPMRDGVKLHTVIVVPRGAKNEPILLTRTPYNASKRAERNLSPHMLATLPRAMRCSCWTAIFVCFRTFAASTAHKATIS